MNNRMMQILETSDLVTDENKEIIEFGLKKICDTVASWIFAVICAGIMGDFLVGVVFEGTYMALRRYAGGYHTKTKVTCLWLTYFTTFICIVSVYVVTIKINIMNAVMIISLGVIYKYSPMESSNKPLNVNEKNIYRRKSIYIALFDLLIYFLLICFDLTIYAKAIFCAMLIVVIGIRFMPQ